jgi:hypothetical protein
VAHNLEAHVVDQPNETVTPRVGVHDCGSDRANVDRVPQRRRKRRPRSTYRRERRQTQTHQPDVTSN